jgi:hypothetical protein
MPGPQWRVVVVATGSCAAVVAGALVVANAPHAGQSVTIRPAAVSSPVSGVTTVLNPSYPGAVAAYAVDFKATSAVPAGAASS